MTIRKITIDDKEYPKNLRNIHKPPARLYVNGMILERDDIAVAIVGSRRATIYGMQMAEKFGYELALGGVTVISGMARGIDSAAHRGALKAKGRTIAVMGSGHNVIYPAENKKLYEEIAATGAVVTEYDNDAIPEPWHFPQRNRIISGMSLGILVIEAARNSGALITAGFAAEQGREVFSLPGKISSATSSGTNELIKDGAKLVQTVDDILEELSIAEAGPLEGPAMAEKGDKISKMTKAYIYNSLTEDERKVYEILSDDPLHIDDISKGSGLERARLSKTLLNMELKKIICELRGKNFIRNSGT